VIELLERIKDAVDGGIPYYLAKQAIDLLQNPTPMTPEQYRETEGEEYPEDGAVYAFDGEEWVACEYWRAKQIDQDLADIDRDFDTEHKHIPIVCAYNLKGPPASDRGPE
jgi:hypothetical protein